MAESAQPTKLRIKLNLLHPKEAPARLPERFLKWLISYGRFIVIFVEIIVVGAFLTRFTLDAELDRLKGQINLDLPYVEGLSTDEALIKQTQAKIALVDKNYQGSDKWQKIIVEISSQIPRSVQFTGLTIEAKDDQSISFRITAVTTSNTDLGIFINNLRALEGFRNINLASISFDRQQILFTVTGDYSDGS